VQNLPDILIFWHFFIGGVIKFVDFLGILTVKSLSDKKVGKYQKMYIFSVVVFLIKKIGNR
jgi:hypothetical protein